MEKQRDQKNVTILGGGIAGLSAGYFSKKKGFGFEIYEATEQVGGNCRTVSFGDFKVDTGAHRFHDKDKEITREIRSLMGDKIQEINVPSFIFHRNKLIHFPLTPANVFFQLSLTEICKAVWYFFSDKLRSSGNDNFLSLACQKYGRFIAGMFLINYSEKLWGEKCCNLSPDVAGARLKDLNFRSMLTEFVFKNSKSKHLEGSFFYPHDGFGTIADELAGFCETKNIHLNSRITGIITNGDRIQEVIVNSEKHIFSEMVINTLPVTKLLQMMSPPPPDEILETVKKLKFRHLKLVVFLLGKNQVKDAATLYFPDSRFIFTRCYEPRNRSRKMSPEGKTSLVAEIPFSDGDKISQLTNEELVTRTRLDLLSTKLIDENEILETHVFSVPFAYPVLTKGYESEYQTIFQWLNRFKNLYVSGRNGRFEYSWVHNMMRWAHDLIKKVKSFSK